MKIQTRAPNFCFNLTKELNENTNKSTKFNLVESLPGVWRVNMMLILRSVQCCHANNKQVIMQCCSHN